MNSSTRHSPQEIADALRARIRAGDLKKGDRLPTQAELADEFGVERGTVRQALRALQEDGLLTHVTRGSPPRVADLPAQRQPGQDARVVLTSYLEEAFQESAVRIDAVCLTAETLMWALIDMHRLVAAGKVRPASVDVRCMLPGPDALLLYPTPVSRTDLTDRVQQALRDQIRSQKAVIEVQIRSLRRDHGIDAVADFRPLPCSPTVKQYVLNGRLGLEGRYTIARYTRELPGEGPVEIFDAHGTQSPLFEFRLEEGGRAAQCVQDMSKHLDSLWDLMAPRQTLAW
ncbi:winged helix-turn-helix domain-containing protein [Streptomyces sp. MUM 2J]|uniref:GntR family transcriptional regulator n=1 Tax=Streptomyces sp. MUM 2J TaxID=2791987 RepID=UPI001F04DFB5|nr:winged helix-turn-helix domain-containing protein [Streptomyces sp. MUM 2J]MCH0566083.1 winged helix-turn-helix transcriptional regulator [Streptomyces sp. MUM 2J]